MEQIDRFETRGVEAVVLHRAVFAHRRWRSPDLER